MLVDCCDWILLVVFELVGFAIEIIKSFGCHLFMGLFKWSRGRRRYVSGKFDLIGLWLENCCWVFIDLRVLFGYVNKIRWRFCRF